MSTRRPEVPPMPETASGVMEVSTRARLMRKFSMAETFREERFFLIVAVFIGVFSGLAVVCFRLAIDWTRIGLLGPLPQRNPLRS